MNFSNAPMDILVEVKAYLTGTFSVEGRE